MSIMDTCSICARPLEHGAFPHLHAECLAEELPREVAGVVLGTLVHLLAPAILVWAA
jgi:hypothetical protein